MCSVAETFEHCQSRTSFAEQSVDLSDSLGHGLSSKRLERLRLLVAKGGSNESESLQGIVETLLLGGSSLPWRIDKDIAVLLIRKVCVVQPGHDLVCRAACPKRRFLGQNHSASSCDE